MVFYGGIKDKLELKFFLLYIMKHISRPIALGDMMDMALCDESVNYFELNEAIDELVASGHLIIEDMDGADGYMLTPKGAETADICEDSLSKGIKNAAQKSVFAVKSRMRRNSNVTAELFEPEPGELKVKCSLNDGLGVILSLELMVTNRRQGIKFAANFKKNAELIYGEVINAMLNEYEDKKEEE